MITPIEEHLANHEEMIPRRFVLRFMKEFCITVVSRLRRRPQTAVLTNNGGRRKLWRNEDWKNPVLWQLRLSFYRYSSF